AAVPAACCLGYDIEHLRDAIAAAARKDTAAKHMHIGRAHRSAAAAGTRHRYGLCATTGATATTAATTHIFIDYPGHRVEGRGRIGGTGRPDIGIGSHGGSGIDNPGIDG